MFYVKYIYIYKKKRYMIMCIRLSEFISIILLYRVIHIYIFLHIHTMDIEERKFMLIFLNNLFVNKYKTYVLHLIFIFFKYLFDFSICVFYIYYIFH